MRSFQAKLLKPRSDICLKTPNPEGFWVTPKTRQVRGNPSQSVPTFQGRGSPLEGFATTSTEPFKGLVWSLWQRWWVGTPPTTFQRKSILLHEFSELAKILLDLGFSDGCRIEVSRVLAETFSSRRNRCSKLEILLRIWHFGRQFPSITVHSEATVEIGVL